MFVSSRQTLHFVAAALLGWVCAGCSPDGAEPADGSMTYDASARAGARESQGTLVRVSPSAAAILGYTLDEMVSRSGADFVYPDDLAAVRTEMKAARRGRHMRNFETRYVHKDGRVITLVWSGVLTFVLLKIIGLIVPLRVSQRSEIEGLDITQHGEALQ